MLYFIPTSLGSHSKELLVEAKILYAFDSKPSSVQALTGPSSEPGLVLWDSKIEGYKGYDSQRQRWRQIPGSKAWVGIDERVEIVPEMLRRASVLHGQQVRLADDRPWEIPIARKRFEDDGQIFFRHMIPQALTCDNDGEWVAGEAIPKYRDLWNLADDYSNWKYSSEPRQGGRTFEFWKELIDAAAVVLSTNYRISVAEISLLGLFSREHAIQVLDVLIDAATLSAWLKKKAEAQLAGENS